ncbi:hypothetical protein AMJ80_02915 [bacterium SM23_31]|nr:MAG: hypothetical protein AMJ80_02915 [bacterium SM23_31]
MFSYCIIAPDERSLFKSMLFILLLKLINENRYTKHYINVKRFCNKIQYFYRDLNMKKRA